VSTPAGRAPEQAGRAVVAVVDDRDQQALALPEAASFGVVSSGAVPPGVGKPASLAWRSLNLRPITDQGNGQGNGQGVTGATHPPGARS